MAREGKSSRKAVAEIIKESISVFVSAHTNTAEALITVLESSVSVPAGVPISTAIATPIGIELSRVTYLCVCFFNQEENSGKK